jgi:hypothetical protein
MPQMVSAATASGTLRLQVVARTMERQQHTPCGWLKLHLSLGATALQQLPSPDFKTEPTRFPCSPTAVVLLHRIPLLLPMELRPPLPGITLLAALPNGTATCHCFRRLGLHLRLEQRWKLLPLLAD